MLLPTHLQIQHSGEIIATDVPYENFLTNFEGQSVEWINGVVIKMSPVRVEHNGLSRFLIALLVQIVPETTGGEVFHDPMVMRAAPDLPARAPDIMVVLPQNMDIVKVNEIVGPADLVIEIVSLDSHRRDRIEKFGEYEKAGVREYWILDPIRDERLFYQLTHDGVFEPVQPDEKGIYHCRVIPKLKFPVRLLQQENIPIGRAINDLIEDLLKD